MRGLEGHLRAAPGGCLCLHGSPGLGKGWLAWALCAHMQRTFPGRTCIVRLPSLQTAPTAEAAAALQRSLVRDALHMLGEQPGGDTSNLQVSRRLQAGDAAAASVPGRCCCSCSCCRHLAQMAWWLLSAQNVVWPSRR